MYTDVFPVMMVCVVLLSCLCFRLSSCGVVGAVFETLWRGLHPAAPYICGLWEGTVREFFDYCCCLSMLAAYGRGLLVGVALLASEHVGDCLDDNLYVEPETPVLDVFYVFLHTSLHLVDISCLASES